jgi:hypothetical protein
VPFITGWGNNKAFPTGKKSKFVYIALLHFWRRSHVLLDIVKTNPMIDDKKTWPARRWYMALFLNALFIYFTNQILSWLFLEANWNETSTKFRLFLRTFNIFQVYQYFTIYRWYFVLNFEHFHEYLIKHIPNTNWNG